MKVSTESFVASDGAELHLYVWLPESVEPRAVGQIVQGMGETGYRYARVAEALCESGYAVYLSDIRGHGHTAPDEASLGDLGPDGWNRCVQDQRELNDALRRRHPQRKAVLLGHSMGSFLAQQYLIDHGTTIDAAILSGSTKLGGGLLPHLAWGIARLEQWRIGDQEGSPLLEWLLFGRSAKSIPDAATPFDWLSRDPEEVQKYIDDPLCGNVLLPRSIGDMFDGARYVAQPENLAQIPKQLPLLIFSGEDDPVHRECAGLEELAADYRAAGLTDVELRFYEGRHEMFNEINRAEVIQDLVYWLAAAL